MEKTKEYLKQLRVIFTCRAIAVLVNQELKDLGHKKTVSVRRINDLSQYIKGDSFTPEINRKAIANVAKRFLR
jgi:hypothetical protein